MIRAAAATMSSRVPMRLPQRFLSAALTVSEYLPTMVVSVYSPYLGGIMRITVFGATGGTGRLVVEQGLAAGHEVTAVIRDRTRLPVPDQDRLRVAVAPRLDHEAVLAAVTGADAVVDALGANDLKPTTVRVDAAEVIIPAMREAGVSRLVAVSAAGFHTTGDPIYLRALVKPVLGYVLRHSFADMAAMAFVVARA